MPTARRASSVLARVVASAAMLLSASVSLAQSLAHEKYTLSNGMTVILHEDRSLPRASINLWYRVGARNEPPGRSGFAHLFEHLMFMGTKRVPGNDFDVLMETGGGSNNATTSLDRTNYFSSGPSSLLPTLLWLDADRLEDMGLCMTQEKLDKQRDVVRNERRQTVENAPYGKAYEASYQLLYPPTHPYHYGVIGTHTDLENAQVQDVKDFFATFYVPNNCSLVIAGDFDKARIKPLVESLFGSLPAGNVAPQRTYPQPRLDRVIRVTTLDRVQLPAVGYSYHSPALYSDGDADMDLVGSLLADGNNSRLYQRLVVKEGLAAEVMASQDSAALGSVFRVTVLALPDADLSRVEAILDEELARLAREGPSNEELEPRKKTFELALVNSLQSIEARADRLNAYEYYFGTPDALARDLERYRKASPASVKAWASAVLRPDGRLVQRVLPEEPQRAQSARDQRPQDFPTAPFTPPSPDGFALPNGLKVMVFPRPGLPLVQVNLVSMPGVALDPTEKAGRSQLLADMLDEGTTSLSGEEFASALQSLGASFGASASQESFGVEMTTLRDGLGKGLDLFAQAVTSPRMDPRDFDRVHRLHVEQLRQADDEPRAVAAKVASRMLWGERNPYGYPSGGTPRTAAGITIADLALARQRVLRPDVCTLIIAGDVTVQDAREMAQKSFGSWTAPTDSLAQTGSYEPNRAPKGMRVYLVDRPGAVQTMLHLRCVSPPYADSARVPRSLLNTILGGSFTSRLNQNLRENHGYTYGARSSFMASRSVGQFVASTSVQSRVTGPALKEFLYELTRISSGDISDDETAKSKETVKADMIGAFGTLAGVAGEASRTARMGVPWSSVSEDLSGADNIDRAALNALAKNAIDLDGAVLVLVGDRATVLAQLADPELGLNLPAPVLVNSEGEPVKETARGQ